MAVFTQARPRRPRQTSASAPRKPTTVEALRRQLPGRASRQDLHHTDIVTGEVVFPDFRFSLADLLPASST